MTEEERQKTKETSETVNQIKINISNLTTDNLISMVEKSYSVILSEDTKSKMKTEVEKAMDTFFTLATMALIMAK